MQAGGGRKLGYIELSCGPRERGQGPQQGGGVPGRESGPEVIRLSDLSQFAQNFIWALKFLHSMKPISSRQSVWLIILEVREGVTYSGN